MFVSQQNMFLKIISNNNTYATTKTKDLIISDNNFKVLILTVYPTRFVQCGYITI